MGKIDLIRNLTPEELEGYEATYRQFRDPLPGEVAALSERRRELIREGKVKPPKKIRRKA